MPGWAGGSLAVPAWSSEPWLWVRGIRLGVKRFGVVEGGSLCMILGGGGGCCLGLIDII